MDYEIDVDNRSPSDRELEDLESKLLECSADCENATKEIYNINQLKDKGIFVLKDVERKYKELNDELNDIHRVYVKCADKASSREECVNQKIKSLTAQRNNLKMELTDLKRNADENRKKLVEIRKMIMIQEKKNMALVRKLKRMMENMHITPKLNERITSVLNDPRISNMKTNTNINNK